MKVELINDVLVVQLPARLDAVGVASIEEQLA
ncbi:MAG: anti-sigma factor antagonist, partial [Chloroflexia bacterium]|nr:anti-sigma factor antagonist [Chloroflexia bacterium]